MSTPEINMESKFGIIGGTLLNALVNVPGEDLVSAVILAAVGAISSFVATFLCKRLVDFVRKRPKPKI